MKKKIFFAIFLTLILLGSFGVKKIWGADCCNPPDYEWNSSTDKCSKTTGAGRIPGNKNCPGFSCDHPPGSNWVCNFSVTIIPPTSAPCVPGSGGSCPSPIVTSSPFDPCKNLAGTPAQDCRDCTGMSLVQPSGAQPTLTFTACTSPPAKFGNLGASCGTWTSLGCIPNDPPNLVGWILGLGSGIAGGIAFLLILFGASQIVMSGGVPEKIAAGKEVITSAVIGLVFIFVSVLVLKIIGVQILGIPGWS